MQTKTFEVGDRVYFVQNGEKDTGVVRRITSRGSYKVSWDWAGDIRDNVETYTAEELEHVR